MVKVRYVDLYSALDDNYLVLKALRRRSHSLKILSLLFLGVQNLQQTQIIG